MSSPKYSKEGLNGFIPPYKGSYILVTGGSGYIGSHCVLELLKEGYNVVVVDNLSNSSEKSLQRVEEISKGKVYFRKVDIRDKEELTKVFQEFGISAVIHFAGSKVPEESTWHPLLYYNNNVGGAISLLECIKESEVKYLLFSSTAAVYGEPRELPIPESHPLNPLSPYGRSKQMVEEIIRDHCNAHPSFNAAILRYFKPIGAHESGLIGEDTREEPYNLLANINSVIDGKFSFLKLDGAGVSDYLHVVDLALGHVAVLRKLTLETPGCLVYNMGSGTGYSAKEVVKAIEKASCKEIPCEIFNDRAGNGIHIVANMSKMSKEVKWKALRGLKVMARDAWNWKWLNPNGFTEK